MTERTIVCGCIKPEADGSAGKILALNLWKTAGEQNVYLRLKDFDQWLYREIPEQFHDLLEIATYLFATDQATPRGEIDVDTFGGRWRRRFHFHIPVRVPEFWNGSEVKKELAGVVDFLSDDYYDFTFYPAKNPPSLYQYFGVLGVSYGPGVDPERVMMFSGGLDSLAGAAEEIFHEKRRVLLVHHQSTPKFNVRQQELRKTLAKEAKELAPSYLSVRVTKGRGLGKEYTQRVRSFLYAALGAIAAKMSGLNGISFFENGVISLNLPMCQQLVGSRATRTTHPRVLAGFERLLTLVAGERFTVENPFMLDTKADVVRRIVRWNCGPLIAISRSCTHTWETSNQYPHCGTCSQCIDRRFGIIAAEAEAYDQVGGYERDVFIESRPSKEDKILGASYVERGNQIAAMKAVDEFAIKYPEVLRALPYLKGNAASTLGKMFDLYQRHAREVKQVIGIMVRKHVDAIIERRLPGDCLLRTVYESGAVTSQPVVAVEPATSAVPENGAAVLPSPRYLLRRGAGVWRLVFDGKEGEIDHGRGISLVAYLLFNPPVGGLHGTELAKRVFGQEILQEASLSADSEPTRQLVQAEAKEWMAVMENPESTDLEKGEAMEQLEQLADVLKVIRPKTEGGAEKQVRAMRRAIARLIAKLLKAKDRKNDPHPALTAFAEHLDNYLWKPSSRFGGNRRSRVRTGVAGQFTYELPEGVVWSE